MGRFLRARAFVLAGLLVLAAWAGKVRAQAGDFPLKEGDVVAMAGDSITAQHLHSNYIEAYCVTRFPKWNLRFRNAGVGGDTVPGVLARLDYDVLCWNPTVVTIELGMNDAGRGPRAVEPYIEEMGTLIERVKAAGARPIFLTASPVNDGTTHDTLKGRNLILDKMASAVVALASIEKLPCADQFHALLDLWGNNMNLPDIVPLGGDSVHTGPVGHLTMAYACLAGLGAPGLVSTACLGPGSADTANCAIKDMKWAASDDALSFERADECLPMPIPTDARAALKLVPLSAKLNQYILKVVWGFKITPPSKWDISIDGTKVATVSMEELGKGWNMSELTEGPIAAQCQEVLALIAKKEAAVSAYREVARWRTPGWLSDPAQDVAARQKAELERLMKSVIAASAEINAAAQPKPHKFVLTAVK